jgi:two-component system, OmpR family, response regulator MprA
MAVPADLLIELLTEMRPTILVVEDDATTREALRRILEGEGYDVHVAVDGEKAIGSLARNRYDAVVLDIALPKVSGTDVMEYVASTTPQLLESIIVVTGLEVAEIRKLFPSVCETLSKPVLPGRLLTSVRRCMRPPESRTNISVA